MPSISSCPDCHRDLTVPDSESAADVLRCPLCGSEFPAERILADSVRFPPLAIVVRSGSSLARGDAPATTAETKPSDTSPFSSALAESAESITAAETGDASSGDRPAERPPEPEHFDAVVEEDETSESLSGLDLSRITISQGAASPAASSEAGASDDADAADSESDTGGSEAAATFEAPTMRVSTQSRPRSGGLTALIVQFVGVVVGGAMGLAIGYYILLWLVGAKADVLELRTKLPSWLLPPIREQLTNADHGPQALVAKPFAETVDNLATSPPPDEQGAQHTAKAIENDISPLARSCPDTSQPAGANESSAVRASFDAPFDEPLDAPFGDPFAEAAADHTSPYLSRERRDAIGQTEPFEQTLPRDEPISIMLGPRNAPTNTFEEIEAALARAGSALRCSHCTSSGLSSPLAGDDHLADDAEAPRREAKTAGRRAACEFCRGSGIGNLTTAVFEELCYLAESLTFVRIGGHEDDADSVREATAGLLRSIGESRSKCDIVGRLAAARLDNLGRTSNGVLLAGTVSQACWEGDLFAVRVILAGVARPVMVLGRDAPQPELAPRDRVLILGSIIENADGNVAGYLGDAPQVVWGGMGLKIPTRE